MYEEIKNSIISHNNNNKALGSDFIPNDDFKKWLTYDKPVMLGNEEILKSIFRLCVYFLG